MPVLNEFEVNLCKIILKDLKKMDKSEQCPTWGCNTCMQLFPKLIRNDHFKECPCRSNYKPKHLINVLNKVIREQPKG